MPCPYAEKRGAVVFCRVINKTVNPFVMPCLSDRYTRCRYFQEAMRREERVEARMAEAVEEKPAPPPSPPTPQPVAVETEAGVGRESPATETVEAVTEARGAKSIEWSHEESEKLADPVYIATVILRSPIVARRSIRVESLDDLERWLKNNIPRWSEECYVLDLRVGGRQLYLKYCKGVLIASASVNNVIGPDEVRDAVKGEARIVVYGPIAET